MPLLIRTVAVVAAGFLVPCSALAGRGSFVSSDPLLNTIWQQSAATAELMVAPPVDLLPGCDVPPTRLAILDGVERDRCEFTGDIAVTGKTLYVVDGAVDSPVKPALVAFAADQRPSGIVPPLTGRAATYMLVDYTAYWIEDVHDYVLYSGDVASARALLANVTRALDRWYPSQMRGGLFENRLGRADYALIDRRDPFVAYYNAQYVRALALGAKLARWAGAPAAAARWTARADRLRPVVRAAFWDSTVGAFKDTLRGPVVHPQDGNAFAVLAGVATPAQARSALGYLDGHTWYAHGNSIADNDAWDGPPWGIHASRRVYPFMGYFELAARFETRLDDSAIDLIRREWGYMAKYGPGTTWETIAPYGGEPLGGSWAHGWSSGAAPALTTYVLGVRPTAPGFATFVVEPHHGDLTSAEGVVPTPRGELKVSWRREGDRVTVQVAAPPGTRWANAPRPRR